MVQTSATTAGWKTAVRTVALNSTMIVKLAAVTSIPKLVTCMLAQLKEAADQSDFYPMNQTCSQFRGHIMSGEKIMNPLVVVNFLPRTISSMQMSPVFMLVLSAKKIKRYIIPMKMERKQK